MSLSFATKLVPETTPEKTAAKAPLITFTEADLVAGKVSYAALANELRAQRELGALTTRLLLVTRQHAMTLAAQLERIERQKNEATGHAIKALMLAKARGVALKEIGALVEHQALGDEL